MKNYQSHSELSNFKSEISKIFNSFIKIQIINLVWLFASFQVSFAQINYEEGYFITNDNQKQACLIKNIDWKKILQSLIIN